MTQLDHKHTNRHKVTLDLSKIMLLPFSAQNSKASIEIIVKGPETYKSVNDVWTNSGKIKTFE